MDFFYKFICMIIRPIAFILFPMKVIGKDKIPKSGGLILCSNHISLIDPVYLSLSCKRPIHYMAKDELFHNRLFGGLIRALGAFPIKRGSKDTGGIKAGTDFINQGKIMGIFVEGTRSKDLKPQRAKSGVALIAHQTGADVLPVAIYSRKKIRPFRRVILRIGDVIPNKELSFNKGAPSEYKAAANKIMGHIKELWEASA